MKHQVIYADPPWQYDFSTSDSRKIENQYPTMTVEEICDLEIPRADNSVCFMWATAPKLPEAMKVLEAWGFVYKSHAVWDKRIMGMGYWFRGQHELLLVGVRGKFSPPPQDQRISSVIIGKRGQHSAKPEIVREWISKAYPKQLKLELFARPDYRQKLDGTNTFDGWDVWGNQAGDPNEQ